MSSDPWHTSAESAAPTPRPELGPVPAAALVGLGVLAVLKGAGLVLVAAAVASGIAGLMAGDLDTRSVLLLGLIGGGLRALAVWGTRVGGHNIAIAVKRDLRGRLWDRLAAGDAEGAEFAEDDDDPRPSAPARIAREREGEGSVSILAADGLDDLDEYYATSLPAIIQAVAVPLIAGLWILGADWLSALIVALTVPLVPLFMALIGKHTQERTDEATGSLARLANHLTELARGLPVLVGLNRAEEQARALDDIQREYRTRLQQTLRTSFLSALALELIATISVAVVAVALGLRLMNDTVELEAALVALLLAPECFTALRQVGSAFHSSQNGLSALARVRRILSGARRGDVRGSELPVVADITSPIDLPLVRTEPQRTEAPEDFPTLDEIASGAAWADEPEGVPDHAPAPITIHDLSVRYADRAAPTLDGLSADIGGITAITGPSGSGKSTLLAAIAGTLPPGADSSGWIVGIDPALVAYAPQVPRAFTATPWDELVLYGSENPEAPLREVGIARLAHSSIAEMSPGELRRLAVARALVRVDHGARVLVLDEPTAHLDERSADRVRDAIRRRASAATVILATHEPATLALAKRTVAVDVATAHPSGAVAVSSPSAAPTASAVSPADGARQEPTSTTVGIPVITDSIRLPDAPDSGSLRLPSLRGPQHYALKPDRPARWRALLRLLRPTTVRWALGILLAAATTGMGLALTAVSGWLIVRASVEEYIMYLLVAIVGVRFFGIGRAVSRYAERLVTHAASFHVTDRLRRRLWRSIAARGAGSRRVLEGGSPVDYLVTLTDELRDLLPRTIPPLAVGVLAVLGITVTTWFTVPQLTGVVGGVLAAAAVIGAVLAIVAARGAHRRRIHERSTLVRGTAALATAADDLRANGVAHPAVTRLDQVGARLARAERWGSLGAGLGSAVAVFACSALAAWAPLLSPATPAELACVIALLALAAVEPIDELIVACHRIPALREVARRIAPLLTMPRPVSTGTAPAPRPVTRLEIDGVAATYPGRSEPVFSGLSGSVGTGEWLVVTGRSGAGKSTLLSVIMGALPAAEGVVRADGVALTDLDPASWRGRVAWCPQDAYVFDSTFRGNLLVGRARDDAPDDAEMLAALARAGLSDLVASLPDGLDTHVGAGGSALSGGERQRLAVARALLNRADVILLDEPAAHLDRPTAEAVMADIRAATEDRIVVLVSHRADVSAPEGSARIEL